MKVFQVVGYKKTGKTTVVSHLIQALREKSYIVFVVKNIHSPARKGADTDTEVMGRAGADRVFLFSRDDASRRDKMNDVLRIAAGTPVRVDFLIIEGFKEESLPRIVCFKEDIRKELLENAFAVSGVVARKKVKEIMGLPVYDIFDPQDSSRLSEAVEGLPECSSPPDWDKCMTDYILTYKKLGL